MNLANSHCQDYINLLKKRKLRLMHTEVNLDCKGLRAEGLYWETNRENLTV